MAQNALLHQINGVVNLALSAEDADDPVVRVLVTQQQNSRSADVARSLETRIDFC